jgi:D-alanine-D-alanine ligase
LLAKPNINLHKIRVNASLLNGLEDISKKKIFALLAGIHGEFVEDGKLQTLLEYFQIPYSGSNSSASALAMDKFRSMLAIYTTGISCPKTSLEEIKDSLVLPPTLSFPVILKPNNLGSSVGVSKITNQKELLTKAFEIKRKLHVAHIILQEFIEGLELSCGVLQTKNNEFIKLPPIEIHPKKSEFFDYSSKYEIGGSEEITPPVSIDKKLSDEISDAAATAHVILGCKTYSRSDFIATNNKFYFLETNTLPGMTSTSLLPQEAAAIGISYPQLLDFLIENS